MRNYILVVPMKYLKIVKRLNNLEAVTSYICFFDRFNRGSDEELRNTDVFYGSDGKCFEEFKIIKDCDISHGEECPTELFSESISRI